MSTIRHAGTTARGGFSLLELIVVLVIIGITATIAVPRYMTSVARFRAESAAGRIQADIELMRTRARAASEPRVFSFNAAGDAYRVNGERGLDQGADYLVDLSRAPYQCDLVEADFGGLSSLTIDGYGAATATGRVVVRAGDEYRTVVVGTSAESVEPGSKTLADVLLDLGGGVTEPLK